MTKRCAVLLIALAHVCGTAARAADLDYAEPLGPAPVFVEPVAVPVAVPLVVPVPVPIVPPYFAPAPMTLPDPTIFSDQIYYMQPDPPAPPQPSRRLSASQAEAFHYGYGRHLSAPHALGFYGHDDRN